MIIWYMTPTSEVRSNLHQYTEENVHLDLIPFVAISTMASAKFAVVAASKLLFIKNGTWSPFIMKLIMMEASNLDIAIRPQMT